MSWRKTLMVAVVALVAVSIFVGGMLVGISLERQRASANTQVEVTQDVKEVTVYVTRTGKKYHRGGCRYLRQSKFPIGLKAAYAQYGPCKVCVPPVPK